MYVDFAIIQISVKRRIYTPPAVANWSNMVIKPDLKSLSLPWAPAKLQNQKSSASNIKHDRSLSIMA